jgi:hypothetical protein
VSLYNMLFGVNPMSDVLLAALGLDRAKVGRFRDCYIDGKFIVVHTRNGGGNRDHWEGWDGSTGEGADCPCCGCFITYRAHKHPNYSHDRDDDFDCTYADIFYTFPAEYSAELTALSEQQGEPPKPGERWQALLASLKAGEP